MAAWLIKVVTGQKTACISCLRGKSDRIDAGVCSYTVLFFCLKTTNFWINDFGHHPWFQLDELDETLDGELDPRLFEREKLRISRFDIVTSLLMALILFLGSFVLMLFIVWLLSGKPKPQPIAPLIENPAGRADNAEGFERDFEPPGAEEVEELQEPTLADTIEAVTDAVSTVAASLTTADTAAVASTAGTGWVTVAHQVLREKAKTSFLVLRDGNLIFRPATSVIRAAVGLLPYRVGRLRRRLSGNRYSVNLASAPKKKHNPNPKTEKRLYFSWKSATPLVQYDRQLLQQAGVQIAGRNIVRFIPNDVEPPKNLEHVLAHIELEYAKEKGYNSVTQIAKTVFESKSADTGYAFSVIEQRYRKGK